LTPLGVTRIVILMHPTSLQKKMASKMTPDQLAASLSATKAAIAKGGGSINLQGTRWMMLQALNAELATR
jgi:hypothetical protein